MTLYLKYRPKNLDELDLLDVGESLKKILSAEKTPHAFLFAGPKGTGKTSAARILAKIVNCEGTSSRLRPPCGKCEQCISITKGNNLDVIEMDAASHRGIDDVRSLRDAVKLAPTKAKKKIYIIDEAHMLTTEASNALLKTLEEPPAHVIFVLATTNPEKLIDTIRSRVTLIQFRKANSDEIVRSLRRVVSGEKIKADDDALKVIADAADGAFRDAIKILEQLIAEEREITKEFLTEFLFKKKIYDIDNFIQILVKKDIRTLLELIRDFDQKGVSVQSFVEALINKLRLGLLSKMGVGSDSIKLEKTDLINLLELLSTASENITTSPIEELPLEIALIKFCGSVMKSDIGNSKADDENGSKKYEVNETKINIKSSAIEDQTSIQASNFDRQTSFSAVNDDIWKNILAQVRPINASIEALLRSSRPIGYDGKTLSLGVFYKFHKERLEDINHRSVLEDIIGKVLQSPTRIECTLVEPPPKKIIEEAKIEPVLTEGHDQDIIKVAEEIFGN